MKYEKKDVYQIVTDKILDALEKDNIAPWRMTWATIAAQNFVSKRAYTGINPILLWIDTQTKGFTCPYWATFKQIKEKGGHVRKGEKSSIVTFWKVYEKEVENDNGDKEKKGFRVLRYYNVFNLEQTEGIEWALPDTRNNGDPIQAADSIYAAYTDSPEVKVNGGNPAYFPKDDFVTMPEITRFDSEAEYYATLFHELVHSTGNKKRLDRKLEGKTNRKEYSREELVAEIGAAMLTAQAGIDCEKVFDNSIAYLDGWKKYLTDDPKALISAAGKAQKAANYINGNKE